MKFTTARLIRSRRRRGLGLIEILIGLAISAILFTAVASAAFAFTRSVRDNQDYLTAVQAGRLSLIQITQKIRSCVACDIVDAPTGVTAPAGTKIGSTLQVITPDSAAEQAYKLRTEANKQQIAFFPNADVNFGYRLANNVSNVRFTGELDTAGTVINVHVTLTISVGDMSITMSDSAAPRREMAVW